MTCSYKRNVTELNVLLHPPLFPSAAQLVGWGKEGIFKFMVTLSAGPILTFHLSTHVTDVPMTRQRGVYVLEELPAGWGWGLPVRGHPPGAVQTRGKRRLGIRWNLKKWVQSSKTEQVGPEAWLHLFPVALLFYPPSRDYDLVMSAQGRVWVFSESKTLRTIKLWWQPKLKLEILKGKVTQPSLLIKLFF